MYLQTTGCKENFTLSLGIYLFRQLVRKVFLYAPCSFSLIFRKPLKFRRFCIDWYNQQFTQYNSSGFQSKTQPNFRSRMNLTQNLYTNSIICFVSTLSKVFSYIRGQKISFMEHQYPQWQWSNGHVCNWFLRFALSLRVVRRGKKGKRK